MSALIWCPFPDESSARQVAARLLDERLIACANFVTVTSLFEWKGEREDGREIAALFKTDAALLEQAVAATEAAHPYDTPAVLGWRCDVAGQSTGRWLGDLVPR